MFSNSELISITLVGGGFAADSNCCGTSTLP